VARRVTWAIPGDIATLTGGYAYDRRIIVELRRLGWEVDVVGLGDGFPRPSAAQKAKAEALLLAAASDHPLVADGLAFGALPEIAGRLHPTRPVVALVHHPLALETGLTAEETAELERSERAALASTRWVVSTSRWTADLLVERFGVAPDRMAVVNPGTDRAPLARGSGDGPVSLISVGAVVPRKGFDVLVEALAPLAHLRWRLTIVGDRQRDAAAVARVDALIAHHELEQRIDCLANVSPQRLVELYVGADLFVLASRFEGYGMAFAEALAHGLPVVGTTGGAAPHTVPAAASRLVAPGDVAQLTEALRELIEDDGRRHALAAAARAAAARLPSWSDSGAKFSNLLARLIKSESSGP
jgi:glycosyltransferase involved in cell wall biosynthesis